jgi:hypothetical protein
MTDPMPTELTPILLAPWGRNGSTALMRLLGSSRDVAAPTIHPYEQYRLTAMLRAAQLFDGRIEAPRHGWGHARLFPGAWEDCLLPLSYDDPGLVDRDAAMRQVFLGSWRGFCVALQEARRTRGLAAARFYAEKSALPLAEAILQYLDCRLIFIMRDPRDVFLSSQQFNRKRADYEFGWKPGVDTTDIVKWHIDRVRGDVEHFERIARGGTVGRLLRYEDMVSTPDHFARNVGGWLATDFDVAALDTELREHGARHLTSRSVTASTERWRREMPDGIAGLYAEIGGDLLDRFGYGR